MTETIFFEKTASLIQAKPELEKKLNIKINITGRKVEIEGSTVNEYEAMIVLDAINSGFSPKDALLLANEGYIFRKINMKDFTRRKNLDDVKARVIGTEGKTKRTIEEISGCKLVIKDKIVCIIGLAESIKDATTAITNLIKGSKQANVYSYLERMNREKAEKPDLGLKTKTEGNKKEKEDEESED